MALIIEDGTGLSNAQSYASVSELQVHAPRGSYTIPAGATESQLEAALIRGTSALDGQYARKWPGYKASSTQALDWPRLSAYDIDGYLLSGVPSGVKLACLESALVEINSPGALLASQDRGGQVIREKVGPVETEYRDGAPAGTSYQTISAMLSRVVSSSGQIRTTR